MDPTIGTRLMALKERAGLSLAELARLAGYRGASSIQKLFRPDYDPKVLDPKVAERLSIALIGRGDPKIESSDFSALTDSASTIEHLLADLRHYNYIASAHIGIHRTKRIASTIKTVGGIDIPLFIREDMSGGIPVHPCPPYLRPRGIIGLYVSVGNMWPRFEEGEPIFYEHQRPPARGDDVVATISVEGSSEEGLLIGRLRLMQDDEVQIDVLSPPDRIVVSRSAVVSVHRVLHATDFLEPVSYAT